MQYFLKSKMIYFGMAIAGLVPIVLLYFYIAWEPGTLGEVLKTCFFIVALIIWVLLSMLVSNIYLRKRLGKVHLILTDKCDPEEYNEKMVKLLDKKAHQKPYMTQLILSYTTGLLAAGRGKEAMSFLESRMTFYQNIKGNSDKAAYYNNLFLAYLEKGELGDAGNALETMKGLIDTVKLHPIEKQSLNEIYNQKKTLLGIARGNYKDSEEVFQSMFQNARSNFERVNAKYTLGMIYLHFGDMIKAREAFEYVVQNGNKLYKVEMAKKQLKKMAG